MSLPVSDTAPSSLNQTATDQLNDFIVHGQFPAATPPPGLTSNLVDPEWRGWLTYMTAAIAVPMYVALSVFALEQYQSQDADMQTR